MRGYKKHPNLHEFDVAILEIESIDDTSFVPICLTHDTTLVGTEGFLVFRMLSGIRIVTPGTVGTTDKCNTSRYSSLEQELCIKVSDCFSSFGYGFFTKKDERWFLRGVVTRFVGLCSHGVVTDISRFYAFITAHHLFESSNLITPNRGKIALDDHPAGRKRPAGQLCESTTALNCEDNANDLLLNISSYSDSNCGYPHRVSGFLFGGIKAEKLKWPWVAAMYVYGDYACTVNFISRTRAVTAAHCIAHEAMPQVDDIHLRIFADQCKIS